MKKLLVVLIFTIILITGCKSSPGFSEVIDKEWKLIDVRLDSKSINFDRNVLANEGFGEIFTLSFNAEMVSGTGAPNRYSAPYTAASDQSINIQLMRSTQMAPIREPEKLKEHDFFTYMQNVSKWVLAEDILELYSKNEAGDEVVLVFAL